ncbi:hypothetical protein SUGI_0538820 [Cryptomeria japonica]|nr:hypothetical protein SUGI_0538820 [Cryptomeria japonica]
MLGCDSIRLNIYLLLKDFRHLEQLDMSLSSESDGESQHLVGQKNLTVQSCIVCITFLLVCGRKRGD